MLHSTGFVNVILKLPQKGLAATLAKIKYKDAKVNCGFFYVLFNNSARTNK